MGLALPRREAPDRNTLAEPAERAAEEARLVAIAYLVWPLAIYESLAPRSDAPQWYRFHMRQALRFGTVAAGAGAIALAWPLLASFAVTSVALTIWLYVVAMLVDAALFVTWLVLALRYSRRAGEGRLFEIPWLTRLTGATPPKR